VYSRVHPEIILFAGPLNSTLVHVWSRELVLKSLGKDYLSVKTRRLRI
jgi:hypothetical protein